MKKQNLYFYFIRNFTVVVALVLVWRGVWYTLDGVDRIIFDNHHRFTAIGGIIAGLILLYLPDKDLKEIEKL